MMINKAGFPQEVDWTTLGGSFADLLKRYESLSVMKKVLARVKECWDRVD